MTTIDPVTAAAGCVSVRELTAERIEEMHRRAEQLEAAMRGAAERSGVPLSVHRVGSLCALYLSEELPPTSMQRSDGEAMARFHLAALNHGVLLAPRGMMVACTVMDDAVTEEVGVRAEGAFADVAAEVSA